MTFYLANSRKPNNDSRCEHSSCSTNICQRVAHHFNNKFKWIFMVPSSHRSGGKCTQMPKTFALPVCVSPRHWLAQVQCTWQCRFALATSDFSSPPLHMPHHDSSWCGLDTSVCVWEREMGREREREREARTWLNDEASICGNGVEQEGVWKEEITVTKGGG